MNWGFGRKSAPADVRPLVPGWLSAISDAGFARRNETQFDDVYRNNPVGGRYRQGSWEIGVSRASQVKIDGLKVVGPQTPAIQSPADGSTIDLQARATIGAILDALRQHGLIAA